MHIHACADRPRLRGCSSCTSTRSRPTARRRSSRSTSSTCRSSATSSRARRAAPSTSASGRWAGCRSSSTATPARCSPSPRSSWSTSTPSPPSSHGSSPATRGPRSRSGAGTVSATRTSRPRCRRTGRARPRLAYADRRPRGERMTTSEAADIFVPHAFAEQLVDLGEVQMNYADAGDASQPALLLIPGADRVVVGLRGGACRCWPSTSRSSPSTCAARAARRARPAATRSTTWATTWSGSSTSSIGRPAIVSGLSSGGVLVGVAVRLRQARAGARRRTTRTRRCSRPRSSPPSATSSARRIGPMFATVEQVPGRPVVASATGTACRPRPDELPESMLRALADAPRLAADRAPDEPPQNLKEYDPEWGRAFWTGTVAARCDHERMLARREGPGAAHPPLPRRSTRRPARLMGAISDLQVRRRPPARHRRRTGVRAPRLCRTRRTRCTATIRSSTRGRSWTGAPTIRSRRPSDVRSTCGFRCRTDPRRGHQRARVAPLAPKSHGAQGHRARRASWPRAPGRGRS